MSFSAGLQVRSIFDICELNNSFKKRTALQANYFNNQLVLARRQSNTGVTWLATELTQGTLTHLIGLI